MLSRCVSHFRTPTPVVSRYVNKISFSSTPVNKGLNYDDGNTTAIYANLKKPYNWFFTMLSSTVMHHLHDLTKNKEDLSILDLACGDGNVSRLIIDNKDKLNKNNIDITAIDISENQIELAQQINGSKAIYRDNINCIVADAKHLQYNKEFDVALSIWCFNYSPNLDTLNEKIKQCYNALKDDGVVLGWTTTNDCMIHQNQLILKDFGLSYFVTNDNSNHVSIKFALENNENELLYMPQFSYSQNTYAELFRNNGFTTIKLFKQNDFIVNSDNLNENELQTTTQFIALPAQPHIFFLLQK